jgi:hypothetical protein
MKFNWGTGIFLFLALFLAAAAVFIIFAARQQVNLVHKDYYDEGVDYSEQMRVDARSRTFSHSFKTKCTDDYFVIQVDEKLVAKMDSGNIHLYRPSDFTKDLSSSFIKNEKDFSSGFKLNKKKLLNGRYILKFTWYSEGLKYEVDQPVNIQ